MNVPITSTHAPSQAVDDDLIEALGYFSEDVSGPTQVSSSPLDLGASSPTKFSEEEPTDEAVHAILLSLEVQDLFSDEKDKVVDVPVSVKSSESSSSSAQQQEKQTSPKKIDRRLRPYSTCKRRNRRRPKHELEYLRAKVLELQEELEALNKTEIGSPSAVCQETALVETGVSSWKEIAQRQKLEACNSFAENRRLRNRLLGQLQVARVLEAAIDKHQKETGGSIGWPVAMTSTDHEIFAQLNASVEKQFAEVNTAFTTSGLSKVLHELSGGLEFKREANGVCIRHEETRLLPFEMQSLHQALWNCLHSGAVVKQTHAQMVTQDHSNLIIRETIELAKSRINVLKRAVFRRYFEKNRVIFVWSSSVEIDGSVSVRLREKGWSTCSTFDFYRGVNAGASKSNNCVQGCMARMAVQLTPEMTKFQSDFEAQRHIGEMTDLIVGTYSQNFGLIHDVVEKVLVKPSKPRPTPSFAVC